MEEDLFERIEQLEARQAKDDELCCMVNRHWNQLDEDTSILLRRFDSSFCEEEGGEDDESSEAASAPPFEKGLLRIVYFPTKVYLVIKTNVILRYFDKRSDLSDCR